MTPKRLAKLLISALYLPFARADRLTILYYHAVTAAQAAGFARQMAKLAKGAAIVDPDHREPLAGRSVAVTFDDAFRSVADHALPVLRRHNIRATIFVPTGHMGDHPGWEMESNGDRAEIVMSADEIRALPAGLIRIGSHSVNHPRLSRLDEDRIEAEVAGSRRTLEEMLGTPVELIAFPYGDHDERVVRRCAEAGYAHVFTVAPQPVDPADPALKRGRTSVSPDDHPLEFYLKMRGAYGWMPLASALKRKLRRNVPL